MKLYKIAIEINIPKVFNGGNNEKDNKEKAAIVVRAEPSNAAPISLTTLLDSPTSVKSWVI